MFIACQLRTGNIDRFIFDLNPDDHSKEIESYYLNKHKEISQQLAKTEKERAKIQKFITKLNSDAVLGYNFAQNPFKMLQEDKLLAGVEALTLEFTSESVEVLRSGHLDA